MKDVLLITTIILVGKVISNELNDMHMALSKACATDHNVNETTIKNMRDGRYPVKVSKDIKLYALCMLLKMGIMNNYGVVDDMSLTNASEQDETYRRTRAYIACIKPVATIVKTDEKAWRFSKCFLKHVPKSRLM